MSDITCAYCKGVVKKDNYLVTEPIQCGTCGSEIDQEEYNLAQERKATLENIGAVIKMIRDEPFDWNDLSKSKKRAFRNFFYKIAVVEERWLYKKTFLDHKVPDLLSMLTEDKMKYLISEWTNKRIYRAVGKLSVNR